MFTISVLTFIREMKVFKNIVGIIFILTGILCNEWVLRILLPPHVVLLFADIMPNWITNLTLVVSGFIFIALKFDYLSLRKAFVSYKYISVICFTTILLFLFSNVFLHLFFSLGSIKDTISKIPYSLKSIKLVKHLYPFLTLKEISDLIYETQTIDFTYSPYTQFKYEEHHGKYVNLDTDGFRLVREQGPWPPDKANFNIFVFGGSTTFGENVTDYQTIPSYLQTFFSNNDLGKKIFVYNFGRPAYFSIQEQVLFIKLIGKNLIPDLAIFIDGLNDLCNSSGDPLFTQNLKKLIDIIENKKISFYDLPLTKFTNLLANKLTKICSPKGTDRSETTIDFVPIEVRVKRYLVNKRVIEVVAREFNVRTLFVLQPISYYKYDLRYHLFADKNSFEDHLDTRNGYRYMEGYIKKYNLGKIFLWLADIQKDIKKPLYIDDLHYSPEMCRIIAKIIHDFLISNNFIP